MTVRNTETFPPVTMGHIRGHGCRDLLVCCISGRCHHSATMHGAWLDDDVPVRSLCSRMACTRCGIGGRRAAGLVTARQQAARLSG
jgi:hypothetical protein